MAFRTQKQRRKAKIEKKESAQRAFLFSFFPFYSLILSASPIGIFLILTYCSMLITKYDTTPITSIFPYVAGATKNVSHPCILCMNNP